MEIRIGFDVVCQCPAPTAMVLMLHTHPERARDLVQAEDLHFTSLEPARDYMDSFGNICTRVIAPAGESRFTGSAIVRDHGGHDPVDIYAQELPIARLPDEVMLYLMGSRYCETDELSSAAWSMFGRVQAIVDFVHNHLRFDYKLARPTRTALHAYNERIGVCRDFAHLSIALCRSMNIPARYCTGYLGDIGVPIAPFPMDFSAWFEVYLSGKWWVFDARHNTPRIGRVLMARGRDAADVSLVTSFGPHNLLRFDVVTDELT